MRRLTTLRQELITALAVVFTGALAVGVTVAVLLLPLFTTSLSVLIFLATLIIADVVVFAFFGRYLVQQRVLAPLEHMIQGVEAIAHGEYDRELPGGETVEMRRLSDAVRRMADHLLTHQEQLAANVRSLEETNRQLTEARNELIRAANLASVGRLSAGIAHEIGNPLGAIMGYLGLTRRRADAKQTELLLAAEGEAQRIDRIVRGLLDFARPRDVKARPIEVPEVVAQTFELVATQGKLSGIEVERELEDDLPQVRADPYQLQQVFVNLLLNAADAMEHTEQPRIRLQARSRLVRPPRRLPIRREDDPPDVDYSHRRRFHQMPRLPRDNPFIRETRVVEVLLEDNGPGIPDELLDQIFEPFVTTKEPGKGTGLGLAVSARIIDAIGGTISAGRAPDGGARFTILLPATNGAATADGAIPE